MLGAISPLTLGAAATALSSAVETIPTPGEFASALRLAGRDKSANVNTSSDSASDATKPAATTPAATTRADLRRMIRHVERSLGRLPGLHDIDTARPIRLKLDTDGAVRAADDHPDAAKINALLAADKDLTAAIANVLRSINATTSPELLGKTSGGASIGEPTLTYLDGTLTPSLG